jgi:hypothetical protein
MRDGKFGMSSTLGLVSRTYNAPRAGLDQISFTIKKKTIIFDGHDIISINELVYYLVVHIYRYCPTLQTPLRQ